MIDFTGIQDPNLRTFLEFDFSHSRKEDPCFLALLPDDAERQLKIVDPRALKWTSKVRLLIERAGSLTKLCTFIETQLPIWQQAPLTVMQRFRLEAQCASLARKVRHYNDKHPHTPLVFSHPFNGILRIILRYPYNLDHPEEVKELCYDKEYDRLALQEGVIRRTLEHYKNVAQGLSISWKIRHQDPQHQSVIQIIPNDCFRSCVEIESTKSFGNRAYQFPTQKEVVIEFRDPDRDTIHSAIFETVKKHFCCHVEH